MIQITIGNSRIYSNFKILDLRLLDVHWLGKHTTQTLNFGVLLQPGARSSASGWFLENETVTIIRFNRGKKKHATVIIFC